MDFKLLALFICLNMINVIIQTIKTLITVKSGKLSSAVANAVAFGFYTIVINYMVCELPMWWKVVIVGAVNFIGVYAVKLFEEKMRKDKLWKVEATVSKEFATKVQNICASADLSFNSFDIENYTVFNFFCETQQESKIVKDLLSRYPVKYFVSESKSL